MPETSHQLVTELPMNISIEEARVAMAAKLFEMGRLSLGQAARLAGYTRPTFMEILGKMGVAVFNYSGEDLEQEMSR